MPFFCFLMHFSWWLSHFTTLAEKLPVFAADIYLISCCVYECILYQYNTMTLYALQNQWSEMFPCTIGRTSIIDVIFSGMDASRNCSLQLVFSSELSLICFFPKP